MERTYLGGSVAKPLSQCLQELVEVRPLDPIEWIAHWLYKYTDSQLYFSEKALFLKELESAHKQMEHRRKMRQALTDCLKNKLQKLEVMAGRGSPGGEGADGAQWWQRKMRGDDGGSGPGTGTDSDGKHSSRGPGGERRGDTSPGGTKVADWKLNCQWGLICEHPLLGDMEPRPPLVYPETPEWWERQGYLKETLYDHEVYSCDNDDPYPGWDQMEHMTYKDFVQEGPWLSEGALRNMQPSLQEVYKMPKKFVKHKHHPQPDDIQFPSTSGE